MGLAANLDLLRAIAVLLVLAQHLCRRMYIDQVGWVPTASLGHFGVLLFFVHTSLVLMYSLERSRLDGWPLLKNFYVRRIFRVYPLSIIAVVTALVLRLDCDINGIRGLSHGQLPGRLVILSNLLLVQNLARIKSIVNVLWSLPFELHVFLPFLFLWIRGKRIFWPLLGLWTIAAIAGTAQAHVPGMASLSILAFVPNFLPGVIAFAVPRVPRFNSSFWPIFIIALIVAFTLYPAPQMGWGLCLLLGILIPSFGEITTDWLRFVSNRIATYSYGIYVSHQFCIWFALGWLAQHSFWLKIPVLISSLALLPIVLSTQLKSR